MENKGVYFGGWDGGGTKTAVCLMDPSGGVVSRAVFGPLNPNGADAERVKETVRGILAFMDARPGGLSACAGLVIGAAGISARSARQLLEVSVRSAYPGPLLLLSDQEIALAGAIEGSGAVLCAGTGSVCLARGADGTTFRVGGYGYLIDDEGSGYAIGRDILKAVAHASDGRGEPTVLEAFVTEKTGAKDMQGVDSWLYAPSTGKADIAALSALLAPACEARDPVALRIAQAAAENLFGLVQTAWRRAGLNRGELALTGSIPERCPPVRDALLRKLRAELPDIRVCAPRRPPEEGAALIALARFGPARGA